MGPRKMTARSWLGGVLVLLLGLSVGCSELAATWPKTPSPRTPTVRPPVLTPSPSPTFPPPISVATQMTITVWTAAEFAPTGEDLARELEEFEATSLMVSVSFGPRGWRARGDW